VIELDVLDLGRRDIFYAGDVGHRDLLLGLFSRGFLFPSLLI
jgi:hypothetical protein